MVSTHVVRVWRTQRWDGDACEVRQGPAIHTHTTRETGRAARATQLCMRKREWQTGQRTGKCPQTRQSSSNARHALGLACTPTFTLKDTRARARPHRHTHTRHSKLPADDQDCVHSQLKVRNLAEYPVLAQLSHTTESAVNDLNVYIYI